MWQFHVEEGIAIEFRFGQRRTDSSRIQNSFLVWRVCLLWFCESGHTQDVTIPLGGGITTEFRIGQKLNGFERIGCSSLDSVLGFWILKRVFICCVICLFDCVTIPHGRKYNWISHWIKAEWIFQGIQHSEKSFEACVDLLWDLLSFVSEGNLYWRKISWLRRFESRACSVRCGAVRMRSVCLGAIAVQTGPDVITKSFHRELLSDGDTCRCGSSGKTRKKDNKKVNASCWNSHRFVNIYNCKKGLHKWMIGVLQLEHRHICEQLKTRISLLSIRRISSVYFCFVTKTVTKG